MQEFIEMLISFYKSVFINIASKNGNFHLSYALVTLLFYNIFLNDNETGGKYSPHFNNV